MNQKENMTKHQQKRREINQLRYDLPSHNLRSISLKSYDYSKPGAYFITICTHNPLCTFGEIVNGEMILNEFGKIAQQYWLEIPKHFLNIELDEFNIMPNHIHGIIFITDVGAIHELPLRNLNQQKQLPKSIKQRRAIAIPKIIGLKWELNIENPQRHKELF